MNIKTFNQQLRAAREQLEILHGCADDSSLSSPPKEVLVGATGVIEALATTLEELLLATEDWQQPDEELSSPHQDLAVERLRYHKLLEFTPEGYLLTDTNQIIQEANSAAATFFKVKQQFLLGKPLRLLIAKEDRKSFYAELCPPTKLQEPKTWELHLQPWRSEPFPAEMTVSAIRNYQGELVGMRWLIRDITERKQAEEFRQKLETEQEFGELKSRFIQTVSHEFRTPLSIILSSTELLEKYSHRFSEEKKSQHFQRIKASVKYTTQLLDDALVLSKVEAGKLEFDPKRLNLQQFCSNLVEEHQLTAGSKYGIHFTARGECFDAYLDERLVGYIFDNLLSNALKYSPQGGIVNFELTCENGNAIARIQDRGIGIPPEDQTKLFEPFHRGRNVGTLPGTGLGLAVVKKAVELHGGAIAFESEVGVGTTFTVTLPLYQIAAKVKNELI